MLALSRFNRAFISGMAVFAASIFVVGCGGGSSGGGGPTPTPTPTASAEEVAAVTQLAVGLSREFAALYDPDLDPDDLLGGGIGTLDFSPEDTLLLATRKVLELASGNGEILPQNTELCESGSVSVTETANDATVNFNSCRFSDAEIGINFFANGRASFSETGPVSGFRDEARIDFDNLRVSLDVGPHVSGDLQANGRIIVAANAGNDARITIDNLGVEFSASCRNLSEGLGLTYDVVQRISPDGAGGIETEINGDASASGSLIGDAEGSYSIQTVAPIRYDASGAAYDGTIRSTYAGTTVEIQFVEGGLFVDGEFYDSDDFEAEYSDLDDRIDALEVCINQELESLFAF